MKTLLKNFIVVAVFGITFSLLSFCGNPGGSNDGGTNRVDSVQALKGDAAAGQSKFTQNCAVAGCHSSAAVGALAVSNLASKAKAQPAFVVDQMLKGNTAGMPSYGSFSDQELANILTYLKSL